MRLFGGVRYVDAPCPNNVGRLDHGALPMISAMQRNGIRLDCAQLHALSTEIYTRQTEIETEIRSHIGDYHYAHSKHGRIPFSVGSRDHLSQLLFEHLKIQGQTELSRTPSGKRFEVSEDVLAPYKKSHPIVPLIIEWHSIDKLDNTYAAVLPTRVDSDSRLHTHINPTVAATGRLAPANPNLANIPTRSKLGKRVRYAFVARRGCSLISADLSQIEMVWAAHRSQDPIMLEVFRNGQDIHTRTACIVHGYDYNQVMALAALVDSGKATHAQSEEYKHFKQFKRLPCKTVGFGVLYGQTPEGVQVTLANEGVFLTIEECTDLIENKFFGVYKLLKAMLERDYRRVLRFAMSWCAFGRVRLVPEAKSCHKHIRSEGIRKAGNHPEQGSAAGTLKVAMAVLTGVLEDINKSYTCLPLLPVHDELIIECDSRIAQEVAWIVQDAMERATPLSIPVRSSSDVADSWGALK
jgi:DNA polymerase I